MELLEESVYRELLLGKYGPNCRTFQQKGEKAGMTTYKGEGTNKNGSSNISLQGSYFPRLFLGN